MSYDVKCPYCEAEQEINHDDGYGYGENEKHQQECGDCEKTFTYTTSISFSYEAEKAPCLNEGQHELEEINGYPKELFAHKKRCKCCNEEIITNKELHEKSCKEYYEKLRKGIK